VEEVLTQAIRCKHCGGDLGESPAGDAAGVRSDIQFKSCWSSLFKCGPGYWHPRIACGIWLLVAVILAQFDENAGGLLVIALLLAGAMSRGEWHTEEVKHAIRGTARHRQSERAEQGP